MENNKKIKLLIIGMSNSIHVTRWIENLSKLDWDIHLFPSIDIGYVNPRIRNVTVHHTIYTPQKNLDNSIRVKGINVLHSTILRFLQNQITSRIKNFRRNRLIKLIQKLRPDIVHSMEFQHAGYLTMEAKEILMDNFPKWIATNWGNDIYLFSRLSSHSQKIKDILKNCDYYSCECQRDVCLAQNEGLQGKILPVFPNTGGFHLKQVYKLRQPGQTSGRRLIMLKGYQGWTGRSLFVLKALDLCANILKGYTLVIYSIDRSKSEFGQSDVEISAELLSKKVGLPIKIISNGTDHTEILQLHGQARISIGANISDGVSTSFLEALTMGSFPIQSWTACADEWIKDGETGFLIDPEDPTNIAQAIRRALTDDSLVDQAAQKNWQTASERLDFKIIENKIANFYQVVLKDEKKQNH